MARFVFKLRALLTQRRWIERRAQTALAEAQQDVRQHRAELARLEQELRQANEFVREGCRTRTIHVSGLIQHRLYLAGMQRRLLEQAQRLTDAEQTVRQRQSELLEAARHRRAVELLRDKHLERWRATQNRVEIADLDEVGTQLAHQNQQSDPARRG